MLKKILTCCVAVLLSLLFVQAQADTLSIEEVTMQIGENAVAYPQLSGMEDLQIQSRINDDVVLSSGVANHMVTLASLAGGAQKLQVNYQANIVQERFFSVVISAKGKLPGVRDGHAYTALTYDLTTGERIGLDALFADVDAAVARMEEMAEETLSEELNGYMEYSDILPLPVDSFTLSEDGITFWYPAEQFSLLSGYSGACQFWYEELAGFWLEEALPAATDAERKEMIAASTAEGVLPHVPAALGQSMAEVTAQFRLLRTPDEFPGGRYFVMEDPQFRQVLLISDSLRDGYEESVVEGIQIKRGGLYGLLIGSTEQPQWRTVLGEPDEVIDFTESMAYDYNLPMGECDVYHYGENKLRLHADENGVLCAIQLCK